MPAYFTDLQVTVIKEASRKADLDVIEIINESAAVLTAPVKERNVTQTSHTMVVHIRSKAVDVSVLRKSEESVEILATAGREYDDTSSDSKPLESSTADHLFSRNLQR